MSIFLLQRLSSTVCINRGFHLLAIGLFPQIVFFLRYLLLRSSDRGVFLLLAPPLFWLPCLPSACTTFILVAVPFFCLHHLYSGCRAFLLLAPPLFWLPCLPCACTTFILVAVPFFFFLLDVSFCSACRVFLLLAVPFFVVFYYLYSFFLLHVLAFFCVHYLPLAKPERQAKESHPRQKKGTVCRRRHSKKNKYTASR